MANSTAMLVLRRIGINNCRTQEAARWRRRRGGEGGLNASLRPHLVRTWASDGPRARLYTLAERNRGKEPFSSRASRFVRM